MADTTKKRIRGGYNPELYNTPIYRSWYNMKTRCFNEAVTDYHRYGGRGITVCAKWLLFKGFYEDMKEGYSKGLTIDRINNNGNYCKENCRWATKTEQANNTRNIERAKKYEVDGIIFTVHQLSEKFKIKRTTLDMRLNKYGWSLNRALSI